MGGFDLELMRPLKSVQHSTAAVRFYSYMQIAVGQPASQRATMEPGTPTGSGTQPDQPATKRRKPADYLETFDPRTFNGILLEPHDEVDKNNKDLKSKSYTTLMASVIHDCNRARRMVVDRHKNMSKKGESIADMKERLPFTKKFATIEITRPYTASNRA